MPIGSTPTRPANDLVLELHDTAVHEETDANGNVLTRATARAVLVHQPLDGQHVRSKPFDLKSPIGPIEKDDLDWYLERYANWPTSVFRERARQIEDLFPVWGQRIRDILVNDATRDAFERWRGGNGNSDRRFTVMTDDVNDGAARWLSIPWELLHGGHVLIQRCVCRKANTEILSISTPIRVLLITARTGRQDVDHRVCARPLFDAFDEVGNLAEITSLQPATVNAMGDELHRASAAGQPYHVVHFDGHGQYDKEKTIGGLLFENEETIELAENRRSAFCPANDLAAILKQSQVPIVILQACQTATTDSDVTASVAGRLNREGVPTVVAMSHSVLVETARRFFTVFYRKLVSGVGIGNAMLRAQRELRNDDFRSHVFKHELRLQDWFVPVLFQDAEPVLVETTPPEVLRNAFAEERRLVLGDLPEPPGHCFVGRNRELLLAERWLGLESYIVLRGEGGEGKTTLAVELVRWLVRIGRYERAAFVSLAHHPDAKAALYELGPQFDSGFVSKAAMDPDKATHILQDALAGQRSLLVFDNMETVLADEDAKAQVLELANELLKVDGTRIVFTSREQLLAPFDENDIDISRLARRDAVRIVANVLEQEDCVPYVADEGESEDEIVQLVDAVQAHARSLVLLAPYVAERGVKATTKDMLGILEDMEAHSPGDRERSLLASVELSLRRLPEGMRERIRPLAVFHGGGHVRNVADVCGLGKLPKDGIPIAVALSKVGLATPSSFGFLRLHPALGPALDRTMTNEERSQARRTWLEATVVLSVYLCEQLSEDTKLSAALTALELPNLLAALDHLRDNGSIEQAVNVATSIEALLQNLGRPRTMARVACLREELASTFENWPLQFNAEMARGERLLDAGQLNEALDSVNKILRQFEAIDTENGLYLETPYNRARVNFRLGRILQRIGDAGAALAALVEAQHRFQEVAKGEHFAAEAKRMTYLCGIEIGDCLRSIGRLDEAERKYENAIILAKESDDRRSAAVAGAQLGYVRLSQQRLQDALDSYLEARQVFAELGDLEGAAKASHQIGMIYQSAEKYTAAEEAYKQALKIRAQLEDRQNQATTLNQIASLYYELRRGEEALRFYRQAVDTFAEAGNLHSEGAVRSNLAHQLLELGLLDEARHEFSRSIRCREKFGHSAELWKAFDGLCNVEKLSGNKDAAAQARDRAISTFMAYRRQGGENHDLAGEIMTSIRQILRLGQTDEAVSFLATALGNDQLPADHVSYYNAIMSVILGERDPALTSNPALHYQAVVELELLLESLTQD